MSGLCFVLTLTRVDRRGDPPQQRDRGRKEPARVRRALPGDPGRRVREERPQVLPGRLAGAQQPGQDGGQLRAFAGLSQVPRAGAVDVAVGLVRDPPDRLGGQPWAECSW